MERKPNENYLSYAKRLTNAVEDGIIEYKEYADSLIGADNVYSADNIRKFYYIFKKVISRLDDNVEVTEDDIRKEIEEMKHELLVERKKLQRVNLEYHANARYRGDHELYVEMVQEAIERLKPIRIVPTKAKREVERTGVLFVSDQHYGKEYQLKGLYGETVNEYSPEIFKARMWKLLSDFENDFDRMKYDKLLIADLGDNIEGILRISGLQKLKVGVMDSALEYAEFMSTWICEVYNRLQIPVEYAGIGGNHDQIRILSNKKDFDGENVSKTIQAHISQRVEISCLKAELESGIRPQIEIAGFSDVIFRNIHGTNVLCYHGEGKNLKEDIEFFENYYQVDIDVIYTGHLHSHSVATAGYANTGDRELIRVPSIVGIDDFSKTIRRSARAGAYFTTYTEDGKDMTKIYYLN